MGRRSPYGAVSPKVQEETRMAGTGRLEDPRDPSPLSIVWLVIRKILQIVLGNSEVCGDN